MFEWLHKQLGLTNAGVLKLGGVGVPMTSIDFNGTALTGALLAGAKMTDGGAKTADFTIAATASNTIYNNTGAAGAITGALPAAVPGLRFGFVVVATQELRIDPDGTETIALPSTKAQSAAGKYIGADAAGEMAVVECFKAGQWEVTYYVGTWTAQS